MKQNSIPRQSSENRAESQKARLIISRYSHKRELYLLIVDNFVDVDGSLSVLPQVSLLLAQQALSAVGTEL